MYNTYKYVTTWDLIFQTGVETFSEAAIVCNLIIRVVTGI